VLIKVKAQDMYGAESGRSDPIPVSMQKNKKTDSFHLLLRLYSDHWPYLRSILDELRSNRWLKLR
jgi:hypothetical protein